MSLTAWLARVTSTAGNAGNQDQAKRGSPPKSASRAGRRASPRFSLSDIRWTPLNIFCITMFYVGLLNFAAFFVGALKLHGDALNGKIIDGHYMLSSHGRLHEVSASVFNYSFWRGISVFFVTHPLALFCIWHLQRDVAKTRAADA